MTGPLIFLTGLGVRLFPVEERYTAALLTNLPMTFTSKLVTAVS